MDTFVVTNESSATVYGALQHRPPATGETRLVVKPAYVSGFAAGLLILLDPSSTSGSI